MTTEEADEAGLEKIKILMQGVDAYVPHPQVALMCLFVLMESVRVRCTDTDAGVCLHDVLQLTPEQGHILQSLSPDWAGGLAELLETCQLLAGL